MKLLKSRAVTLAIFVASCSFAHASLLVGFYDGTTPGNADVATAGFSGNLAGTSSLAGSNWNSQDGTFGPDSAPGITGAVGSPANGSFGFGGSGPRTVSMTMSNASGSTYALGNLLFDFTNDFTYPTKYQIRYSLNGGSPVTALAYGPTNNTGGTSGSSLSNNWTDVAVSLIGVMLQSGQSIVFYFDTTNGGAIDNVAVTGINAVPEPASLVALGCVLGSGLMLRNRRRQPAAIA